MKFGLPLRLGVAAVVSCALVGCSSGSSSKGATKKKSSSSSTIIIPPTTTTTTIPPPPSPATTAAVRSYLTGPGAKLMTAERIFQPTFHLPRYPTIAQCAPLPAKLQAAFGPTTQVKGLTDAIPDPVLAKLFYSDLTAKNVFLSVCKDSRAPANGLAFLYTELHRREVPFVRRLGQLGISI